MKIYQPIRLWFNRSHPPFFPNEMKKIDSASQTLILGTKMVTKMEERLTPTKNWSKKFGILQKRYWNKSGKKFCQEVSTWRKFPSRSNAWFPKQPWRQLFTRVQIFSPAPLDTVSFSFSFSFQAMPDIDSLAQGFPLSSRRGYLSGFLMRRLSRIYKRQSFLSFLCLMLLVRKLFCASHKHWFNLISLCVSVLYKPRCNKKWPAGKTEAGDYG